MLNLFLTIWCMAALAMLLTWLIQIKTKDASYVDVTWAGGIGFMAVYTFLLYSDYSMRKILICSLAVFWSIRLSTHLIKRLQFLQQEDSRYHTMRNTMGSKANVGFLVFFQVQAIFIVVFSAPIVLSLLTESTTLGVLDIIGILIFIISITGESLSDRQLLKHKQANNNNTTCRTGMWYYSRHPNYFFECLHWFTYVCFCFFSLYFWIVIFAPFLMMYFIIFITGIPHVERESLAKRSDYEDYIKTTPMIIPNIFKK